MVLPLATTSSTPTVTEATQQSRAEAIWETYRLIDERETAIEADLLTLIAAENAAAKVYEDAKEARKSAQARHVLSKGVESLQDNLEILKAQFLTSRQASDPKTVETPDGNKVQVREKTAPYMGAMK